VQRSELLKIIMWLNKMAPPWIVSKTIPAVLVVILARSASLLKIKSTSGINGRKNLFALFKTHYTQGTHGVSMMSIVAEIN
jgi:hypothetical protein